jgi:hypothetical protein
MLRNVLVILALAVLGIASAPASLTGQVEAIPDRMRARTLPRQHLSGPRFGFTTFTGDVARLRDAAGLAPIMSQFGWQAETQLVSTDTGHQALIEWLFLLGGVEDEDPTFSTSWLAGLRTPGGYEFGVGPNLSFTTQEGSGVTTSMVVAGGMTLPFGQLYVPLNLAVAFADGGPRITTLLGWIVG